MSEHLENAHDVENIHWSQKLRWTYQDSRGEDHFENLYILVYPYGKTFSWLILSWCYGHLATGWDRATAIEAVNQARQDGLILANKKLIEEREQAIERTNLADAVKRCMSMGDIGNWARNELDALIDSAKESGDWSIVHTGHTDAEAHFEEIVSEDEWTDNDFGARDLVIHLMTEEYIDALDGLTLPPDTIQECDIETDKEDYSPGDDLTAKVSFEGKSAEATEEWDGDDDLEWFIEHVADTAFDDLVEEWDPRYP